MTVSRTQGVRVRRVARLGKPMQLNVQGGYDGGVGQGADALALTPLVFLLDPAPFESDGTLSFSSGGNEGPPQPRPVPAPPPSDVLAQIAQGNRPGVCGQGVAMYLMDTWAVMRVFSRTPPATEGLGAASNGGQGSLRRRMCRG